MPADAAEIERHLSFDTVFNFRDLGGYDGDRRPDDPVAHALPSRRPAPHERRRVGRVRRARHPHRRRPAHTRRARGAGRFSAADVGAGYHHLPVLDVIWDRGLGHRPRRRPSTSSPSATSRCSTSAAPTLAGALGLAADPESLPLVFHCAAGKDRTGVLAALLLSLLGVADDVIAHDYSLSGIGMRRFREWFEKTFPDRVEAMADQPAAFMDAARRGDAALPRRASGAPRLGGGLRRRHRRSRRGRRCHPGQPAHGCCDDTLTTSPVM